jgi:hypothetical protein
MQFTQLIFSLVIASNVIMGVAAKQETLHGVCSSFIQLFHISLNLLLTFV